MAKMVCAEYLRGMSWVLAYYSCGSNPVVTSQSSVAYEHDETVEKSKKRADTEPKGQLYASWDW